MATAMAQHRCLAAHSCVVLSQLILEIIAWIKRQACHKALQQVEPATHTHTQGYAGGKTHSHMHNGFKRPPFVIGVIRIETN